MDRTYPGRSTWVVAVMVATLGMVACGSGSRSGTSVSLTASLATTTLRATTTSAASTTTSGRPSTLASTTVVSTVSSTSSTSVVSDSTALARIAGESGLVTAWRAGDAVVVGPPTADARSLNGAVIEAGGAVVPFPPTAGPAGQVVRLGDKVLVISTFSRDTATTIDMYSLSAHRWSRPAVHVSTGQFPYAFLAGDVVMIISREAGTSSESPGEARVELVHADGSVTEGALPDDPWALPEAGGMAVWTGSEVAIYGVDSNAYSTHLARPTTYNPSTNSYRTLSNPPWVTCDPNCAWVSQHQGGDHQFATWTGTRSLVFTTLGHSETTGLHDPVSDAWEQVPNPPIALSQPWVEAAGRFVTVFATNAGPTYSSESDDSVAVPRGVAAVFDTEARTWSTVRFADPSAPGISWRLCPARVEDALIVSTCLQMSDPIAPMALDPATGRWSPATDRQRAEALLGIEPLTLVELAAALRP
jgi:hypothetical protein